jgi:hypothetical protein
MAESKVVKNLHMRITIEVIGTEGLDMMLKYSFTDIETVKMVEAAIAQALLGLNK